MSVFHNQRRRRDFLTLMVMLQNASGVAREPRYRAILQGSAFELMEQLADAHMAAVPDKHQRDAELTKVKQTLMATVPPAYKTWAADYNLWYLLQLVYRLVSSGWKIPLNSLEAEFVRRLFMMAEHFSPNPLPDPTRMNYAISAPEMFQAKGIFA